MSSTKIDGDCRLLQRIDCVLSFVRDWDKLTLDPHFVSNGITIQEFGSNLVLMRNVMTMEEQFQLTAAMQKEKAKQSRFGKLQDKTHRVNVFINWSQIPQFESSVYPVMLNKAVSVLERNYKLHGINNLRQSELWDMKALYYPEKIGSLANHCDKLDGAIVFLFSIGCTARFYVHCPSMKGDKWTNGKVFAFRSGDILFFDSSNAAQVIHGIDSIDDSTSCPPELKQRFPDTGKFRIGLQMRAFYPKH